MFPKTIRPNLDTNVNVQLLNPAPGLDTTVVVSLLDENNATLVSEMRTTGNYDKSVQTMAPNLSKTWHQICPNFGAHVKNLAPSLRYFDKLK